MPLNKRRVASTVASIAIVLLIVGGGGELFFRYLPQSIKALADAYQRESQMVQPAEELPPGWYPADHARPATNAQAVATALFARERRLLAKRDERLEAAAPNQPARHPEPANDPRTVAFILSGSLILFALAAYAMAHKRLGANTASPLAELNLPRARRH